MSRLGGDVALGKNDSDRIIFTVSFCEVEKRIKGQQLKVMHKYELKSSSDLDAFPKSREREPNQTTRQKHHTWSFTHRGK